MKNKNYTATIEVAKSLKDVFNHINDVSNWWAKDAGEAPSGQKTEKGKAQNLMMSLSSYQETGIIQSRS